MGEPIHEAALELQDFLRLMHSRACFEVDDYVRLFTWSFCRLDFVKEFPRVGRANLLHVTFSPQFLSGGKQWIHTGDPVEIVVLPTERVSSGTGSGPIPLSDKGEKAAPNVLRTIWCMFDSP